MTLDERRKKELSDLGLTNLGRIFWNQPAPSLYEEIVRRREGIIAFMGPVVVRTGHHTGRLPHDKFFVKEPSSYDKIWWGDVNKGLDEDKFEILYRRMLAYLQGKDLFIQDCYGGVDQRYRVPIRVIAENAWHSLFSRNMLLKVKSQEEAEAYRPEFTIINAPRFHAVPEIDGTRSEAFIIINLGKKIILIGGTSYGGEIKKSVFTLMNYLLPQKNVLSMHCSANVGAAGDCAVFFGLSGTGKTSLSADPERRLVGDDEHGWSDNGVFNFEGGCYAKVIRLSPTAEPDIYATTRMFGTILENVGIDLETRRVDLDDASLTENTRAGYPLTHIANVVQEGFCGHPKNVVMLTCDAFGVMPPISRLTPEQAEYHFLSGYTAKVAGTEVGLTEPKTTFSTCFGAPFMALPPSVYATLLRQKIKEHKVNCWLLNTGWMGEPAGKTDRIPIKYSRALVKAALSGELDGVGYDTEPHFRLAIPKCCPDVPPEILNPVNASRDRAEYANRAQSLLGSFRQNFDQFADCVAPSVRGLLD